MSLTTPLWSNRGLRPLLAEPFSQFTAASRRPKYNAPIRCIVPHKLNGPIKTEARPFVAEKTGSNLPSLHSARFLATGQSVNLLARTESGWRYFRKITCLDSVRMRSLCQSNRALLWIKGPIPSELRSPKSLSIWLSSIMENI